MAIIRIEKKTDGTFRANKELYDDSRQRTIYLFGIKIFSFVWDMKYKGDDTRTESKIGFTK